MDKKSLLFIFRSTPYGSSQAQEGIDTLLTASAFEQDTSVLFMNVAAWQLYYHQSSLGIKKPVAGSPSTHSNIASQISSFPLYDIKNIYIDKSAFRQCGVLKKELIIQPRAVNKREIHELIEQHDTVLTY